MFWSFLSIKVSDEREDVMFLLRGRSELTGCPEGGSPPAVMLQLTDPPVVASARYNLSSSKCIGTSRQGFQSAMLLKAFFFFVDVFLC